MLNAFRHQRLFHPCPSYPAPAATCAQRLSTSEVVSSVAFQGSVGATGRCSTPFDIRGCFIWARRRSGHEENTVLTAFRHQRLFHLQSAVSGATGYSAQRLSTSEVVSCPGSRMTAAQPSSAQRLSTSEVVSSRGAPRLRSSLPVLNAFRHQRLFHTTRKNRVPSPAGVLNAFRHQRLFHR